MSFAVSAVGTAAGRRSKSADGSIAVASAGSVRPGLFERPSLFERSELLERCQRAGHLPIALDAMGGDHAPAVVVAGARVAYEELGLPIVLYGLADQLGEVGEVPVVVVSEAIAMDAEPGVSVRRMKDSSLVRAAESVRDGWTSAMVSAGNTGATMASALLRMGRLRGVSRPAIAASVPTPGSTYTVLVDAGANSECQPEWLGQFARMGVVYSRLRYDVARPQVGVLSIGEESGKGNQMVKVVHDLLARPGYFDVVDGRFVGNVEGRDLMTTAVDVAVTDGFTGNVALKTLEGALVGVTDQLRLMAKGDPNLLKVADELQRSLDPEETGAAMLLGVRGLCMIYHGSASAEAIANGLSLTHQLLRKDVVGKLAAAMAPLA